MNQLDTLCQKFGTTINYLIPKVIEFGKYENRLGLIIVGIIFVVSAIVAIWLNKKSNEPNISFTEENLYFGISVISEIIAILMLIGLILYSVDFIKWHSYPEMMAYKYILNIIGKD